MKKTLSRAIARSTALMLSFMLMFGTVRTPVFASQDEAADAQVELFLDENAGDSFTDEGAAEQAAGQQIDIIDENGEIVGDADQPVEDAFDEAGAQAEAEAEAPAEVPAEEEAEAGQDAASQEEEASASQEEYAASQEEPPAEVPIEYEAPAEQEEASQEPKEVTGQEEEPPVEVPTVNEEPVNRENQGETSSSELNDAGQDSQIDNDTDFAAFEEEEKQGDDEEYERAESNASDNTSDDKEIDEPPVEETFNDFDEESVAEEAGNAVISSGSDLGYSTPYTLSSSKIYLDLDLVYDSTTQIVLTCGTTLSEYVYIDDTSAKRGNVAAASLDHIEGNKAYYNIQLYTTGTQDLKFTLMAKKSANYYVGKDSVSVRVKVSCSHLYNKNGVPNAVISYEKGIMTYTCLMCGHQKTEKIQPKSISNSDIILSSTNFTYSGSACIPSVTVKLGSKTLSSGTDYTVSYTNNTNAGTAKVTVTGKGNYSGSASKNFTIQKAAQSLNATVSATSLKKGATTQITASGIGTITYTSSDTSVAAVSSTGLITAKAAGKAAITVTAAGNANYNSAKKTISITVTETKPAAVTTPVSISFSETSVTLDKGRSRVITATTYGDLPSTFNFSCVRSDTSVMSVAWTGSWKQSNGKYSHDLTITGLADGKAVITVYVKDVNTGKYVVGKSINITVKSPVSPAPASNKIIGSGVTLSKTSYTYNGKAKKPGVTVKVGGKKLINGTDYKLSYSSNIKAGTAVVTVTGKGKYTGVVRKTFTINKASQNFNLIRSSYTYKKSDLKKNKQRVPIIAYNYKGTLSKRSASKYIYFSNGICYVKKGTPKGTYKVIVSASGNKNYKTQQKTVTITIK